MAAESGAGGGFLQKFRLYETRSKFYMIGRDKSRTQCRVLTIDRLEPSELSIREDPTMYSEAECYDLLKRIHDGNRATGGLKLVTKCYGIVGFVKFLGPYYMLLITKRRKIGTICGHVVYTVSKSEIITIPSPTIRFNMAYSKDENRSFVHSACKNCVMPGVLLMKAIISSKLETCCPLVLWDFIVMNSYSFLGINHLNCSGLIFLLYYYTIVAVILLTLYLFRTSISVVCNHFRELDILQFLIQFSLFYL